MDSREMETALLDKLQHFVDIERHQVRVDMHGDAVIPADILDLMLETAMDLARMVERMGR